MKSSHILKIFLSVGEKSWLYCCGVQHEGCLRGSVHELNSGKTLAAPTLAPHRKKKINSSLIYQTIDLSGICSIFYKALLDKDLILWTCSFLALKWFCDILAAHIGSKSIFTHCGNFLFRESSDDFWICFLVTSSTPTPWSYWDF